MALAIAALVLAALCGIRTWFAPWLVVFAAWVGLASPPTGLALGQPGIVAVLTVLWAAEIGADKVIGLDRRLETVGLALKPVIATLVAIAAWPDVSPVVAGVVGATVGGASAFGLAWAKAGLRRFATSRLPGVGNVLVSVGEDVFVVLTGLLALLAPVAALVWSAMAIAAVGTLVRVAQSPVPLVRAGLPAPRSRL